MTSIKVKVVPYKGKYALQDEDSRDYFYTTKGTVRVFQTPSEAVYWLKSVCTRFPGLGYTITLPGGKIKYAGANPNESFGPHKWVRDNLVTHSDLTETYRCEYCGLKVRAYFGLSRPSDSGVCKKNPKEKP